MKKAILDWNNHNWKDASFTAIGMIVNGKYILLHEHDIKGESGVCSLCGLTKEEQDANNT